MDTNMMQFIAEEKKEYLAATMTVFSVVATNPFLPAPSSQSRCTFYWYLDDIDDVKMARRAFRSVFRGAIWDKNDPKNNPYTYALSTKCDGVRIVLECPRDNACVSVVVGQETVTVSEPVTTYVEKTITRDIIEWQCK